MIYRWRKVISLAVLGLIGLGLTGLGYRYMTQEEPDRGTPEPIDRDIEEPEPPEEDFIPEKIPGNVRPYRTATITAPVSGTIRDRKISEGQVIQANQVPDNRPEYIQSEDTSTTDLPSPEERRNVSFPPFAEEQIFIAFETRRDHQLLKERELQIEQSKLELEKARRDLNRIQQAIEKGGEGTIYSESDVDQAKHTVHVAEKQYNLARTRYWQQVETLNDHYVTVPFAGKINEVFVEEGEWIRQGEPLFTLLDQSKVKIVFHVTERLLPLIREKNEMTFTVDAYPNRDEPFTGTVDSISPSTDENFQRFRVTLVLSNPDDTPLQSGMICRIQVEEQ